MNGNVNLRRLKLIVILVGVAFVTVIGVLFVVHLVSSKTQVVNKLTGDLSVFEQSDINNIEVRLKDYLKVFYGMSTEEIAQVDMAIRDNSIEVAEYEGVKGVDFIVDLSNPKLTYAGTLIVGGTDDELFLVCPALSIMQDKDVFCIGHERESTIDDELGDYLPYETNIDADDYFSLWVDYDDDDLPVIKASLAVCKDDDAEKERMKNVIYDWISSKTTVKPEVFPIEMDYLDCDWSDEDYYDFSGSPDEIRYEDSEE